MSVIEDPKEELETPLEEIQEETQEEKAPIVEEEAEPVILEEPIIDEIVESTEEGEVFYERYAFVVDKGQSPTRVDKFLAMRIERVSRSKLQNAAKAGCIYVNEKVVKSNYKTRPLDEIKVLLTKPVVNYEIVPEEIPLDFLYEDDSLMVINKQAGLVVHPGIGNYTGTMVHGILHHLNMNPIQYKKGTEEEVRPGLVHRLDKNTSGILVVAKTEYAKAHLAKQFFDRTTERVYTAIVWGELDEDEGTITGNIGRHERLRKIMDVFPEGDQGKHAVTHYKVLERLGYVTQVECRLETGRTHQIRVHFKHIKHALFNDPQYGGDRILKGTVYTKYKQFVDNCFKILPRQALHARMLGFTHPETGEKMRFEVPLAADMAELIEKWKKYMRGSSSFEQT